MVATPLALVDAVDELRVPQVPLDVKVTTSPAPTGVPLEVVTVAVTVELLEPPAAMVEGLAVTATVFGGAVCWITTVPAVAPLASVAVTVHCPCVVDAV
jgi:hypothetical protein